MTGTHYLIGEGPRGPWRVAPGPMLDGAEPAVRYAARIVEDDGVLRLLGFRWFEAGTTRFAGWIEDPADVDVLEDGRLTLVA